MGQDTRLLADLEGDHINFHNGLCDTDSLGLETALVGPAVLCQGDVAEAAMWALCPLPGG